MAKIVEHVLPSGSIMIKEGSQVIPGEDLGDFYTEAVARHLAQAEGKDPDDPTIRADIMKRIKPPGGPVRPFVR